MRTGYFDMLGISLRPRACPGIWSWTLGPHLFFLRIGTYICQSHDVETRKVALYRSCILTFKCLNVNLLINYVSPTYTKHRPYPLCMCNVTHDLYTLNPAHELSHFLRPLPWSVTYFIDGPLITGSISNQVHSCDTALPVQVPSQNSGSRGDSMALRW